MSKIIRLKHLPEEAESSDIRKFFKRIDIPEGGVRILGGEKGIVYITFNSEDDVLQAIEKDGKKITPEGCKKGKRIRVVESSTREMQRAIDEIVHGPDVARQMRRERERLITPPPPGDVFIQLVEIPVGIGLKEIAGFFEKLTVTQVKLVGDGVAYVQFKDVDMKQEALTFDRRFLSTKFVKVQHLNEEVWDKCETPSLRIERKKSRPLKSESEKSKTKSDDQIDQPDKPSKKPKNGACVSVTGLSKSFKKKQIVHELFKDSKITNYGLYMETQNGVCTGKCYVEFVDMEGRDRAIKSSHDKKFHGKTVSVIAISHDEMETKVRLHRKMLKQAEFLKRQADKERREVLKEDESSNYEPTLPQNEPSPIPGPPPDEEESPDENDSASSSPIGNGLSSFYGEYTDNRFEKKDVISVPSSPEKSPINLDSDDNDGKIFNRGAAEKFKPITSRKKNILGKIKMNLKQNDSEESVLSRLTKERAEFERNDSPLPEPDSTTLSADVKNSSDDEDGTPLKAAPMPVPNPMQLLMMQNMIQSFAHIQQMQQQQASASNVYAPPVQVPVPVPAPAPVPAPETANPYAMPFNPVPAARDHRSPFTVTNENPIIPTQPSQNPNPGARQGSGWLDDEPPLRRKPGQSRWERAPTEPAGPDAKRQRGNDDDRRSNAFRDQSDTAHSDRGHSVRGHSDRGHSDRGHSDRGHSDKGHSERGHSDRGHSDRGHSDRGHSDRGHSDRGHSDRGHSDRGHSDRGQSERGHRGGRFQARPPFEQSRFNSPPMRPRGGHGGPRFDGPRGVNPRNQSPDSGPPLAGFRPSRPDGPRPPRFESSASHRGGRFDSPRPRFDGPRTDRGGRFDRGNDRGGFRPRFENRNGPPRGSFRGRGDFDRGRGRGDFRPRGRGPSRP